MVKMTVSSNIYSTFILQIIREEAEEEETQKIQKQVQKSKG